MDGAATAKVATIEDDSRLAADLTLLAASAASLIGVGLALLQAGGEEGRRQGSHDGQLLR